MKSLFKSFLLGLLAFSFGLGMGSLILAMRRSKGVNSTDSPFGPLHLVDGAQAMIQTGIPDTKPIGDSSPKASDPAPTSPAAAIKAAAPLFFAIPRSALQPHPTVVLPEYMGRTESGWPYYKN